MIMVIDYGMGNIRSIEKALKKINAEFFVSSNPDDLKKASKIILPGVGFFEQGMKNLGEMGFIESLKEQVLKNKKPILGICLGMQLLFNTSEEGGLIQGLGFVNGDVKRFSFKTNHLKIPHMGWNNVFSKDSSQNPLFDEIEENSNFYFIHSYHAVLNEKINAKYTDYGYDFVSVIQKDNIFATQFHPEKSQDKGLKLLKNFALRC